MAATKRRPWKITFFSVVWFCVFVLSGAGLSAYFHPLNLFVGLALFLVGFLVPLVLSQLIHILSGRR